MKNAKCPGCAGDLKWSWCHDNYTVAGKEATVHEINPDGAIGSIAILQKCPHCKEQLGIMLNGKVFIDEQLGWVDWEADNNSTGEAPTSSKDENISTGSVHNLKWSDVWDILHYLQRRNVQFKINLYSNKWILIKNIIKFKEKGTGAVLQTKNHGLREVKYSEIKNIKW